MNLVQQGSASIVDNIENYENFFRTQNLFQICNYINLHYKAILLLFSRQETSYKKTIISFIC